MSAPTEGQTGFTSVKYNGYTWSDGTYTTKVMTISPDGYVLSCYGATLPVGTAGYAIGCEFIHSDGGSGTARYVNNGTVTVCSFSAIPTTAGTTATAITVANSTDTTSYIVFVGDPTGDQGPKTNTGLTFNATTGVLTATGFAGPITGDVTGNVSGNAGTVTVDSTTSDTSCFVLLSESASGSLEPQTDATLTYNAATGILTAAGFVGDVTGTATSAATSTLAAAATILATPRAIGGVSFDGSASIVPQSIQVLDTVDTSTFVALFEDATGNLLPKTDAGLTYNAATAALTATSFNGAIVGSGAGLTTNSVKPTALPAVPTDLGNATITVDFSNSNAANITNLVTDGTVTAAGFSGPITGSGAGLTANTVSPTALPNVPTDMGNATITVDISNSNGANVTNFITDGTVTGSAFVGSGASLTANTVSPKALPATPTDMGDATITVDISNSNGANVTNFITDGSCTAGSFSGSASGLTAGSVKASALQSAAADLGAADVTINLGNTNGAFVTNITTDGTITAATFSGAISGTGAGLTVNTVKPTALPNAPTDLGDATITVDISNSNGANITNFITDGSITGGSLVTATSTTTGSLISTPVDSDLVEGNVTLAVANKYVVTVDGAGAGSAITALTGGTAGQTLIIIGICTTADVSLTDGANLQMAGGTGPTLSTNDTIMLACVDGTKWVEVCRSNN